MSERNISLTKNEHLSRFYTETVKCNRQHHYEMKSILITGRIGSFRFSQHFTGFVLKEAFVFDLSLMITPSHPFLVPSLGKILKWKNMFAASNVCRSEKRVVASKIHS